MTTSAISVKLDDNLKSRVKQLAQRQQRSAHRIMREAIRDYVVKEEAKEKFAQEALASWSSYKQTGKHLTGDEVREWLQAWGTDSETEIPECHE
ncbi:MAG: ribbon-helix-helix protein, CopG family [Desulfuromonadales bacterium]|nr:ribbon-helix-helix protein, CopG family [Desulfuromonadales bacterium]